MWADEDADMSGYTVEELVFAAINHDLGKMGDDQHESYIPQTDQWRKDKLGEDYMFNTKLAFARSFSAETVIGIPFFQAPSPFCAQ